MQIVSGNQASLPRGLYSELGTYRRQVFVEILGWDLPSLVGFEQDQFDRPDTVYVVAKSDDGAIAGCARLLPTTEPYLLSEVFPELLNGQPAPRSATVWELSRFAAVDVGSATPVRPGQLSSPIAVALLRAAIRAAACRGARCLITVSPVGIERLLRHAGFQAHRAGPPVVVGGSPLFACWIEVMAEH